LLLEGKRRESTGRHLADAIFCFTPGGRRKEKSLPVLVGFKWDGFSGGREKGEVPDLPAPPRQEKGRVRPAVSNSEERGNSRRRGGRRKRGGKVLDALYSRPKKTRPHHSSAAEEREGATETFLDHPDAPEETEGKGDCVCLSRGEREGGADVPRREKVTFTPPPKEKKGEKKKGPLPLINQDGTISQAWGKRKWEGNFEKFLPAAQ